jgi:Zn-dependent oligopeptidase
MRLRAGSLILALAVLGQAGKAEAASLDWSLEAPAIQARCADAISGLRLQADALARSTGPRSFAATVLPFETALADARDGIAAPLFLADVTSKSSIRDAAFDCRAKFMSAVAELLARPDVYAVIASARTRTSDGRDARALGAYWLQRFRRGGATLDPGQRTEFVRLSQSLVETQERYQRDLVDERTASAEDAALFAHAIALRDRMAHLLGYESWADFRLAAMVPGSLGQAQALLRALESAAPQRTERAARALPLQPALDDALRVTGGEFGVDFLPEANVRAWDPSVLAYSVEDRATHRRIGTLYFDLYRRQGKLGQDATVAVLPVRAQRPATIAVLMNWTPTARHARPSIDGDQLVSLFAQLGRAIALLLPSSPYEALNEPTIEASQLDAALCERFARFVDAGASNPFEFAAAIAAAKTDLEVHSNGPHVNAAGVSQVVRDELMNGWDVRLYLRPWAEAYAEKLFAALTPNGTLDLEAGMRYRSDLLAPARRDPLDAALTAFLGRPAQLDSP